LGSFRYGKAAKEGTLHYMEEAFILVFTRNGENLAQFLRTDANEAKMKKKNQHF
jgi:hypothetical protein